MSSGIIALFSLFSLFLLLFFWFWCYQDYRTDAVRQKLFNLRDDLFDEAAKGNISFDHPAYVMLRTTINGFVRFAHRLNLIHTILLIVILDQKDYQESKLFSQRLTENMNSLNESQKEIIKNIYLKMNFIIIRHLFFSSFFGILFIVPWKYVFKAKQAVDRIRGPLDKIDSVAFATGNI